jgi:sRNA-binding regulator protein Hfq
MEKIGVIPISDTQMIRIRDDRKTVSFTLINGHTLAGQVLWFDSFAYHVGTDQGELTLPRHAYKVHV